LIQFGDAATIGRVLILRHIVQEHIYKVVESQKSAHHLLVVLHDDVDAGADAFVHQFCKESQANRQKLATASLYTLSSFTHPMASGWRCWKGAERQSYLCEICFTIIYYNNWSSAKNFGSEVNNAEFCAKSGHIGTIGGQCCQILLISLAGKLINYLKI